MRVKVTSYPLKEVRHTSVLNGQLTSFSSPSTVIVFSCYTLPCTTVLLSLTRYLVIFSLKVFSCYTLPNIVLLLCFALQCSLVLNTVIFDMHWFIPCLTLFYLVVLCFELISCYPLLILFLCDTLPYIVQL